MRTSEHEKMHKVLQRKTFPSLFDIIKTRIQRTAALPHTQKETKLTEKKEKKKPRFIKLEYATKDRNDNDNPAMKHDRNFNIFASVVLVEFLLCILEMCNGIASSCKAKKKLFQIRWENIVNGT